MDNKIFCTSCGEEMVFGTNLCESCGQINKQPIHENYTDSELSSGTTGIDISNFHTTNETTNMKHSGVDFVVNKPKLLSFKEFTDLLIAYIVIYVGFVIRRILVSSSIISSILESILLIVAVFGFWFFLDKVVSYTFHYYPKFIYDPEKSLMSLIFAFIFIGFPPGHYKYRLWMKKLPNPNNILKVQYITYFILIIYGWFWYGLTKIGLPFELGIISVIPFIIAISVGIAILPFGNFKIIYERNKMQYFILAFFVIVLFIESYQLLLISNF